MIVEGEDESQSINWYLSPEQGVPETLSTDSTECGQMNEELTNGQEDSLRIWSMLSSNLTLDTAASEQRFILSRWWWWATGEGGGVGTGLLNLRSRYSRRNPLEELISWLFSSRLAMFEVAWLPHCTDFSRDRGVDRFEDEGWSDDELFEVAVVAMLAVLLGSLDAGGSIERVGSRGKNSSVQATSFPAVEPWEEEKEEKYPRDSSSAESGHWPLSLETRGPDAVLLAASLITSWLATATGSNLTALSAGNTESSSSTSSSSLSFGASLLNGWVRQLPRQWVTLGRLAAVSTLLDGDTRGILAIPLHAWIGVALLGPPEERQQLLSILLLRQRVYLQSQSELLPFGCLRWTDMLDVDS